MVDLLEDMKTNAPPYQARQAALRAISRRRSSSGATRSLSSKLPARRGYLRDLPEARLVWSDGRHFLLDENLQTVAGAIRRILPGSGDQSGNGLAAAMQPLLPRRRHLTLRECRNASRTRVRTTSTARSAAGLQQVTDLNARTTRNGTTKPEGWCQG